MADSYIGENTDLILGREFLTWLWFKSETGNVFATRNGEPFSVSMEHRLSVRGGDGENKETATVSGTFSPLREARLGLLTGKMVVSALIRFEKDGMDWTLTLKAEDFCLNAFKTPKVIKDSEDADPDALFLEKMYLLDTGLEMLDALYAKFLEVRLYTEAWRSETENVARWMRHDISQGAMAVE